MKKRKILTFVVDRANYGRLKPVLLAIKEREMLDSVIIASGSMILRRFRSPVDVMIGDGLNPCYQIEMEVEGSNHRSMAKSIGLGIIEFTTIISQEKPDLVLIIGDRYEALAAVISSTYLNIPVAHIQGGEVSGSLDESSRHAISKFSKIHFPSTERAAHYLFKMGERKDSIFLVGCPVGDVIKNIPKEVPLELINSQVLGPQLQFEKPFLLVMQHPNTTGPDELPLLKCLLNVIYEIDIPTIWLWPNIDASSDLYLKELRKFRESLPNSKVSFAINFEPETFQFLLKNASCAIGNSSSFVRDSGFSGTPVVLVGARQEGREFSDNVKLVEGYDEDNIKNTILHQIKAGTYDISYLYGDGDAAKKIVDILEEIDLNFDQKVLDYIYR